MPRFFFHRLPPRIPVSLWCFFIFFLLSKIPMERKTIREPPRRKVKISQPKVNMLLRNEYPHDKITANSALKEERCPIKITQEQKQRTVYATFGIMDDAVKHNQVKKFFTGQLGIEAEAITRIFLHPVKKPLHGFITFQDIRFVSKVLGHNNGKYLLQSNGKSIHLKPWMDQYQDRFGQASRTLG